MDFLIDDSEREPELPSEGHPLRKLGARLTELLDEDHWAECERLLLEGWQHDEIDRKTGKHWREDSGLQTWFPLTAEELERLRVENDALRAEVERLNAIIADQQTNMGALKRELFVANGEVERLNKAIKWEENRAGRIGTHAPDCWRWGSSHYECALREVERLTAALRVIRQHLAKDPSALACSIIATCDAALSTNAAEAQPPAARREG